LPERRALPETVVMQPEIRYAQSGDVNGAYHVTGEGPLDVVPLRAALRRLSSPGGWRVTTGEIPRRLSSFAPLIVFDRRGVGMSDSVVGESLETGMGDVRAVSDERGC